MNCTRTFRTEEKKYKPLWVRFSTACSWRTSQPFKTNGKGIGRRKDEKHHPGLVQPPTPPFLLPSHVQPAPPHQSTLFFIGSRPGSYDRQVKVLHSNFLYNINIFTFTLCAGWVISYQLKSWHKKWHIIADCITHSYPRCMWAGQVVQCEKIFTPVPTDRGVCCAFNPQSILR